MANLYSKAKAYHLVLENIYKRYKMNWTKNLGLSYQISLENFSHLLSLRCKIEERTILRTIRSCEESLKRKKISQSEVLSLIRQLDSIERRMDENVRRN